MLLPLYKTFRKVYDKIYAKGTELTGIKKTYFLGNRLGLRYEPYGANGFWYEFN
jgi:long-chain acyl-CoA synthetase